MKEPDTRTWREEHALPRRPESVLLYSPEPIVFSRLKGVLHLHQLGYSEPSPGTVLVAADSDLLALAVRQWRESLTSNECTEVRGVLFESRTPSSEDLARAPMYLEELDQVLARMHTRWLVKLLAKNSLSIVFQPLVSLATKACVACECLVRGDQEGNPVDAESILSTARLLGMSHELDHAAWRAALKRGRSLMQNGVILFLNFAPSSLYSPKFDIERTKALCNEMHVNLSQLVFEVTESERVTDLNLLKSIMQEYRAAGAKIALDDLGSGYSSILHLADLRPEYVKLDQRMVHNAYGDNLRSVLLKAITEAAHKLDIQVVAEGVETEADLKFCLEIGADLAQGYFLARPAELPLPISAEAIKVLNDWDSSPPIPT